MKAKPGKAPVSTKSKKAVAKAKPVAKKVSKPASKNTTKPVAKTKPVVKVAAKKSKPLVKLSPKPASKAKTPVKAPVKTKAGAKPTPKAVTKKPTQAPAKAPPKVSIKATLSPSKKPVPPSKVKAAAKPTPKVTPKVPAKPVKQEPVVVAVATPATSTVPARAGRPSSRLAQLTVPSMAQSVASTAAKASYLQTQTAPLIVPLTPTAIKKDLKLANNWKTKAADQLSDAELLAMPDSEYMNEKQLAAFRGKLVTLKKDILSNAGETTEHLREDTSVVPDPADRATIEEEHALELRTRDRERKLLKKIEQSINRIDAGDYGYCDETGEPIGVGRLLARPTATLSLEAQQRRELKQKMFGD